MSAMLMASDGAADSRRPVLPAANTVITISLFIIQMSAHIFFKIKCSLCNQDHLHSMIQMALDRTEQRKAVEDHLYFINARNLTICAYQGRD